MNELIISSANDIIGIIIDLVLALAVVYFLPWLGAVLKKFVIDKAVKAAEQKITGSGLGVEKKAWALGILSKFRIKANETTDALLESAVYELNEAKKKLAEVEVIKSAK